MSTKNIPFQTIDWNSVPITEHEGESGTAQWQTTQYSGLRVRIVEMSKNYIADHWCKKGHVVHCLEGVLTTQLDNGEKHILTKGMTYIVSDGMDAHLSISGTGAKLLILDGEFLEQQ
ncbi:DHCW motif cupin fold protein [Muricauda sp. CAU 1633]|uniref:DHCW motif cupin fold protein n=1 Tax=Allomuricauda sp. CAU 1633 TaxID=2816036 RepID=UPI001A8CFE22|nr:DHCW motif cupin fold protein [Muricauda sp. CAU 1633]MBO0323895.1 DHCW motif cupin fold protein [Muricauda sp. CAU 1633]